MNEDKIYLLKHDYSHIGDTDYDACLVPFEGSDLLGAKMFGIEKFEFPELVYFQADFNNIPMIDFPVVDVSFSAMSKKMINLLLTLKPFPHRIMPLVLFDDTYLENRFELNGNLKKEIKKDEDYIAIQLMEYTDAFDSNLSVYKMSRAFPDRVGVVSKLVLKTPMHGFPPIFKIKEVGWELFITEEAKQLLDANNIRGCSFIEVLYNNKEGFANSIM